MAFKKQLVKRQSVIVIFFPVGQKTLHRVLQSVCEKLMNCKDDLDELDRLCGDADCGSTVANGAQGSLITFNLISENVFTFKQKS